MSEVDIESVSTEVILTELKRRYVSLYKPEKRLVLIGPPMSGTSTQGAHLRREYRVCEISGRRLISDAIKQQQRMDREKQNISDNNIIDNNNKHDNKQYDERQHEYKESESDYKNSVGVDINKNSVGVDINKNIKEQRGVDFKSYYDSNLVCDSVCENNIFKILKDRLTRNECRRGFVFHHFPQNISQAEKLSALVEDIGSAIEKVVHISIDEKEAIDRLNKSNNNTHTHTHTHTHTLTFCISIKIIYI
eukprot:GHVR01181198.1.p1 GENE.GHVR01181198.1~~GHVR01181198.1.p1  ORF type:complete len:249 (+),score=108.47 GHVR01181198.1:69-815(+)